MRFTSGLAAFSRFGAVVGAVPSGSPPATCQNRHPLQATPPVTAEPAAPVAEPAALTWDPKPITVWAEPDAASVASPADATR